MINSEFMDEFLPKKEPKKDLVAAPEKTEDTLPAENKVDYIVTNQVEQDIISVIERIEMANTDITFNYNDWLRCGLALANQLGERGRQYYHRVSCIYFAYSHSECDKQFNACLKDNGKGVTIKSFFHLAKEAGVDIHCEDSTPAVVYSEDTSDTNFTEAPIAKTVFENQESAPLIYDTPLIPGEVFSNLPTILRESCELFNPGIEQDVLLVSTFGVLSSCLPNVIGKYFNYYLSAHLYVFIIAAAASGKGVLKWARCFGQSIHDHLSGQTRNAQAAYELELEMYESQTKAQKLSGKRPLEPKRKMHFIPGNSSASALIQTLDENNNSGIIFETEADTMANTAKQDWGDSSDIFRKGFEHEPVSLNRRKDNELREIKDPHIAIVVSGTPGQVHRLIPQVDNGVFSRFVYYKFKDIGGFKNPFVSVKNVNYLEFFKQKGIEIFELYQLLQNRTQPIIFQVTVAQGERFKDYFDQMLTKDRLLIGDDFDANVKRMGIIHFRIAMILTVLRMYEDGEITDILTCSDHDFETAMTIVTTLEQHAIAVYHSMPSNGLKGKKLAFYEKLPQKFDRQCYLKVAASLGIQAKLAEYYIAQFQPKLISHDVHNEYTKITN